MDWLTIFLHRGASLDFPAVTEVNRHGILTNTAEAYMQSGLIYLKSPECTYNKIYIPRSIVIAEKKLRLFTAVRAAGSWKGYVRSPHIKLVVFRSLIARGRAQRRSLWDEPTPPCLMRLFDPSLPNGVFWHIASYWRGEVPPPTGIRSLVKVTGNH
jgi:hypothetical protein